MRHHLHSSPDPPSTRLGRSGPTDLDAVLLACLAKRQEERPAGARALRERLRGCAAYGLWAPERAARWWETHRPRLRASRAAVREPFAGAEAAHLTLTRIAE